MGGRARPAQADRPVRLRQTGQVTAERLRETFGEGIYRYPDSAFPEGVTHEPTRRFLTETGMPEWLVELGLSADGKLPTIPERYRADAAEDGEEADIPTEFGYGIADLFVLGLLESESFLCLDGATGVLYRMSDLNRLDLVSSSVEAFAGVLDTLRRAGGTLDDLTVEAKNAAIRRLTGELEIADPMAWTVNDQEWPGLVYHHGSIGLFVME